MKIDDRLTDATPPPSSPSRLQLTLPLTAPPGDEEGAAFSGGGAEEGSERAGPDGAGGAATALAILLGRGMDGQPPLAR